MEIGYLTDIITLLLAAVIVVPLFQSLGLGAIPGFLVAGVILGPSGLAIFETYEKISHLAELGVVLLLFVIGVEINPSRLWKMKGLVLGLGSLQIIVTGSLIMLLSHMLIDISWEVALLIGAALALSSTAFVLQLLSEKKLLASDYGRPSVAILLMQDLAVVPLLALVSLMAAPDLSIAEDVYLALAETLLILIAIILSARFILPPVLNALTRYGSPEIFTASALLLVLGTAQTMESIGLSMAMGAFIAGLLIADSSYRHQIIAEIQPFRGLLLGLFFMTMGMSLNLALVFDHPFYFLAIVAALLTVKFVTLIPLTWLFGIKGKTSISVALLLAQSGEFALVLFAMANGLNLLEEVLFQQLLIIVMLSMLITPLLDKAAYRNFFSTKSTSTPKNNLYIRDNTPETPKVLLAGFGRMGQKVGHIMELMEIPYTAIDNNPDIVNQQRSKGRSVYFGDVQKAEVLRAAGVANAPFVIVSIDDIEATEKAVATFHSHFPNIPVFARGHDLERCSELKKLGAYSVASETLEASAELSRAALIYIKADEQQIDSVLKQFRNEYYCRLQHDQNDDS